LMLMIDLIDLIGLIGLIGQIVRLGMYLCFLVDM
jgi:hypothetical protein